jgi:renalase
MPDKPQTTDVLIVGAGIAGLAAATDLHAAGRTVLVVDKGRGVGGRLASRRIGAATFDHGAQGVSGSRLNNQQ